MGINKELLPVKAHFFFFMAASGPILPYLTVYGKQLGISEILMGSITAVVPITFVLAKPVFGFLADYFYKKRKLVFMTLIVSLSVFYLSLYFIPPINIEAEYMREKANAKRSSLCLGDASKTVNSTIDIKCNVTCTTESSACEIVGLEREGDFCYETTRTQACNWTEIPLECHNQCLLQIADGGHLFRSFQFYGFIALMTLSMIFFNVSNSISDAICFDMLAGNGGENNYGYQRVWGAIGFGTTAFLGGVGMDLWSGGEVKNYTPAFALVLIFTVFDMICCLKLQLPELTTSKNILKDLTKVLKNKSMSIFLIFATLIGILDGFIIYFMFWFLEDLAIEANQTSHIKVLEGLTVAAETLGGEIIFFLLSGKILEKIGYGHTLSLCFLNYAFRLFLISWISNPWWIIAVELLMQGPTYALSYTTIVAYANAISPPGTSATMQGVVAGMDDGFGYALGSLIGGFLYKIVGGRWAFQIFSGVAILCCLGHLVLYKLVLSKSYEQGHPKDYNPPQEALQLADTI